MYQLQVQGYVRRPFLMEYKVLPAVRLPWARQMNLRRVRADLLEQQRLVPDCSGGQTGPGHSSSQGGWHRWRNPDEAQHADTSAVPEVADVALGRRWDLKAERVSAIHAHGASKGDGSVPVVDARLEGLHHLLASPVVISVRDQGETFSNAGLAHGVERLLEDELYDTTFCETHGTVIVA